MIHYLMLGDHGAHRDAFGAYLSALSQGASQDQAASRAFGDLQKLQAELQRYLSGLTLPAIQVPVAAKVADGEMAARSLSPAEVDAYCGGFLELHSQFEKAEPLLKEAAQLDPQLALAQRNLALLHYFRKENGEALASLSTAIALDSRDSMTRYLRARLTFSDVSRTDPQIEGDLRQSLQLKPDFAEANDLLAIDLAQNSGSLPEAFTFGQKAVSLEPGNQAFQLNLAQILVRLQRYDDAELIAHRVRAAAVDETFRTQSDQLLTYVTQARERDARLRQMQGDAAARAAASAPTATPAGAPNPTITNPGYGTLSPTRTTYVDGVPTQVLCTDNGMDVTITIAAQPAPLTFHIENRYRIGYSNNSPGIHKDIEPCTELNGHAIRITYDPSGPNASQGRVTHIEVEK